MAQFFERFLLLSAERLRHIDADVHDDVAATASVALHGRQSLVFQSDGFAGLRARLDFELLLSVAEQWNFHLATECRRRKVEQQVVEQVLTVANKRVVALFFDENLNVSVDAVVLTGVAFARHIDDHSVGNACGNRDFDDFLALRDARSATVRTLVFDDRALAVTSRTLALRLHHSENRAHRPDRETLTVTGRTSLAATAIFGTASVTFGAGDVFFQLEFLGDARRHFLQGQTDFQSQVGTAILRPLTTATEAAETSKTTASAENVAEHRENIVHRETAAETAETAHSAQSFKAELVVLLAFLRIAEHAVGFGSLLELLLGVFVVGIAVGMVFDGNFPICLLDFVVRGRLADSQNLVIISLSQTF